tara:strand:- start:1122 stop:1382 length:261 start_codon:yes stop_codon:yes gene_type:complete
MASKRNRETACIHGLGEWQMAARGSKFKIVAWGGPEWAANISVFLGDESHADDCHIMLTEAEATALAGWLKDAVQTSAEERASEGA